MQINIQIYTDIILSHATTEVSAIHFKPLSLSQIDVLGFQL